MSISGAGARRRKHGRARVRPDRAGQISPQSRHREARRHAQGRWPRPRSAPRSTVRSSACSAKAAPRWASCSRPLGIAHPSIGKLPGFEPEPFSNQELMLQAQSLSKLPGIRHGFFTREGGVSEGVYAKPQWRRRLRGFARQGRREPRPHGGGSSALRRTVSSPAYQIHSPEVVVAETPWPSSERPRADAIVTRTPRLAIGVSTADCGPVLLADPEARVIGAAHRRLARRADRRDRTNGRGDGKARRRARTDRGGGRTDDPSARITRSART